MDVIKTFIENHKRDIIYIGVIIAALVFCLFSVRSCQSKSSDINDLNHNIIALSDSISYYKTKNGQLVAEKTAIIGDMETLKLTNEDLYNKLKDMKIKNAEQALEIKGLVENPKYDTTWVFSTDTLYRNLEFAKSFEKKDNYRLLDGTVSLKDNNMQLSINHDEVYFDYTIAIEDGVVYLNSDNPYVKFDSVYGLIAAKEKPKHWNLGIQVGIGGQYGLINKKIDVGPYIGVGISYGFGF